MRNKRQESRLEMLLTISTEGDHIKVTASCYPFPTVCADKQSTDWFQSISRTLKWNERERQKSFVVVEENPHPKTRGEKQPLAETIPEEMPSQVEDEEEEDEEDSDGEEEAEDSFDIDVTSPLESKVIVNGTSTAGEWRAINKTDELLEAKKEVDSGICFVKALQNARLTPHSTTAPGSGSPDRFGQPAPHPPAVSPRHIGLGMHTTRMDVPKLELGQPSIELDSVNPPAYEEGDRLVSPMTGRKEKGGDMEMETESPSLKTPRPQNVKPRPHYHGADRPSRLRARTFNGRNWRSKSHDTGRGERAQQCAFAAWGYDESDPSDSDNNS